MSAKGQVSGRVVVFILFTGAFLLFTIVLMVGLKSKADRRPEGTLAAGDSLVAVQDIRQWMQSMPATWVKVSKVEGQGWVVYVPCYSPNSALNLHSAPDSLPLLACEYCDSLERFAVKAIIRTSLNALPTATDTAFELQMDPPTGKVQILSVTESLLKNFPEAPFKEKILLWTRTRDGGRIDSMVFVPKSRETEFEVLRAEDENPEGCGGADLETSVEGDSVGTNPPAD